MLDYKDILTKRYVLHMSLREIAEETGAGKSGIHDFLKAFERCEDLDFPLPPRYYKCWDRSESVWKGAWPGRA